MKYNLDIFVNNYNSEDYIIASYYIESETTIEDAAYNLAVGQSIGNPSLRNEFESPELINEFCAKIIIEDKNAKKGNIKILFPKKNWSLKNDGICHLLVQLFGGQLDIDIIKVCHLTDIKFPKDILKEFKGPKFGLSGMRKILNQYNKPLFGGIVKPKIGLSPRKHLEIVKILLDGGCDFIKEDEILSQQIWCNINDRCSLVMDYIRTHDYKTFYCVSLHSDHDIILNTIRNLYNNYGINGVHVNFHCGMGIYKSIRNLDLPILIHFQKSGDRLVSEPSHRFHINSKVIFYLASLSGCDTLHIGMIGGYLQSDEKETKSIISILNNNNSVPALSCGMHPGLVKYINNKLNNNNWMANVGGALMSHPMGSLSGTIAMRQAIDNNNGEEFNCAIKKWGIKK